MYPDYEWQWHDCSESEHRMREDREFKEYIRKEDRKDAATKIQAVVRMLIEKAMYPLRLALANAGG